MPKPVLRRSVRRHKWHRHLGRGWTAGKGARATALISQYRDHLARLIAPGKANRICTIRQFARGRDGHPETDAAVIAYSLATAMLLAERTRCSASFHARRAGAQFYLPRVQRCALFQGDLAHKLAAQDLANLHALGRRLPLLVGRAFDFSGDRVELFACVIERSHVLRFHHEQNIEVMGRGGVAKQNFVIEDEVLFLRFVQCAFERFGEAFKVFIAHAVFRFDHGDVPNGPFGVRRVALCGAKSSPRCEQRGTGGKDEVFFHVDWSSNY